MGANKAKVPWYIKAFNTIIFILAVVASIINIINSKSLTGNVNDSIMQLMFIFLPVTVTKVGTNLMHHIHLVVLS